MADTTATNGRVRIPRDPSNDYTQEMAATRRDFVEERTGAELRHVGKYSFDPARCRATSRTSSAWPRCRSASPGRCASTASTPRATSTFRWPPPRARSSRATTAACACSPSAAASDTVVEEPMQRAPVFVFDDARRGARLRRLGRGELRRDQGRGRGDDAVSASCIDIGQYAVGPLRYLRFNYTTGDAAGQNMTGKATLAACEWIKATIPARRSYLLSGNIDTDKKHSQHQHAADPRPARGGRGGASDATLLRADDGRRHRSTLFRCAADLATPERSWPARPTTAPTPPTAWPRCSSPPGRTWPTWPSRTPPSSTRSCSTTGTTTGRSPCPR